MTKKLTNAWIIAAVMAATALLLLALSFIGYRGAQPAAAPTAAAKAPIPGQPTIAVPPTPSANLPRPTAAAGVATPVNKVAPATLPPGPGIPPIPGDKAPTTSPTGLAYIDEVVGTGAQPAITQTVVVHYTGYLENGTVFDSSVKRGTPATFPLGNVIPGFREGISTMKVGGKRRLIIPPNLGYGDRGAPPTIPGGAKLTFDIELISLK